MVSSRAGLYIHINLIFRKTINSVTFTIFCISGFFTCGCYLRIGMILLGEVS